TSYPNNSELTLGGITAGNVISGEINITNPPGSSFTQRINVTKSGGGSWTLNGVFSSSGTLTVTDGTLTLSGTNTYGGPTAVQGGTLVAKTNAPHNANGAFGKSGSEVNLGLANGDSNASILIEGPYTIGRNIRLLTQNISDSGSRVLTLGGNTADSSVFSGSVILGTNNNAGRSITLTAASGGRVTFSGVIQNPTGMDATAFTVTKAGAGAVELGNSNTYTGATLISGGTLEITGATQATSSITFASGGVLGFTLGSSVTAASAAVDLTGGQIQVTGVPSGPSHILLTASSISGTPVLANPVPGYELEVVGNQLQLNEITPPDPYAAWSVAADFAADFAADANGDGVQNGLAWALGATDANAN
ncbi:MAG TPA: autotransporter-associated beta strand repeat-containing protein, partial [Verrucomicrobiae bacterium]|nr:autotransporter-associated beta strand repeat-containing protein [Verrucomicrobiae bacterium]